MSLIQRVGGMDMAEIIVSLVMTKSVMPNCYLPEFKVYGHACSHSKALFVFDEDENQFLPYMPLEEASDEYLMLADLNRELKVAKGLEVRDCVA